MRKGGRNDIVQSVEAIDLEDFFCGKERKTALTNISHGLRRDRERGNGGEHKEGPNTPLINRRSFFLFL